MSSQRVKSPMLRPQFLAQIIATVLIFGALGWSISAAGRRNTLSPGASQRNETEVLFSASEKPPPRSRLSTRKKWRFYEDAPSWCHPLKHSRNATATPDCIGAPNCKNYERVFGQFGQTYYLLRSHFGRLSRRGIYLDIAANDPQVQSNSFFLDNCLGWDGLCVEPNPMHHSKLRSDRSCQVEPRCLSETEEEKVTFMFADKVGGIVDTNKHLHQDIGYLTPEMIQRNETLTCTRVSTLLKDASVNHVDFLSLDVEGHEIHVLRSIDFARVRINVILVETSAVSHADIEKYLLERDYVRHMVPEGAADRTRNGFIHEDAVFVRKDVTWGEPV